MPGRLMFGAALVAALFLSACGGGDGYPIGTPIPKPLAYRSDLYVTFYFGQSSTFTETADYSNLAWVRPGSVPELIDRLTAARHAGMKVVIDISDQGFGNAQSVRLAFLALNLLGLLNDVVAIYIHDEVDKYRSEAEIRAWVPTLRGIMAEFPDTLGKAKLAMIYGPDEHYVAVDLFDWAGFDDYGPRENVLTNGKLGRLKAKLRPDQRVLIVAGGADQWRQDAKPFCDYANGDPSVVALVVFMYDVRIENGVPVLGVRDNGMLPGYRACGLLSTGRPGA